MLLGSDQICACMELLFKNGFPPTQNMLCQYFHDNGQTCALGMLLGKEGNEVIEGIIRYLLSDEVRKTAFQYKHRDAINLTK